MADASPVTLVAGFEIQPNTGATPFVQQLYQLQTTAPERIEAVYMLLDYGGTEPTFQQFDIQLWDPAGNVLYEQPTPFLSATDNSNLTVALTWSRLGNDSAQSAFYIYDDMASGFSRGFANMRLPDLVLPSQATVQFLFWGAIETSSGTIPVSNCTVTTTRDAGAVSGTTTVQGIPLLTDASA